MAEAGRSASCGDLAKYAQDISVMDLSIKKRGKHSDSNITDSGFIEHLGEETGSRRADEQTTLVKDRIGKNSNSQDHSAESLSEVTRKEENVTASSNINSGNSESSFSDEERSLSSSERSVDSYIELAELYEVETTNTAGEEDLIICEEVAEVSCSPASPPSFSAIRSPKSADVILRGPAPISQYMRAVEHTDRPMLISDKLRCEHRKQYRFKTETMIARDEHGNSYCLMCFRTDMFGRSFYIVPHKTPVDHDCPEKLLLNCVEATHEEVVVEKLSEKNIQFWYTFKTAPFPCLESLAYRNYLLSFEDGRTVVLRRHGKEETSTIDIIDHKKFKCLDRIKRCAQSLFCAR